MLPLAHFEIMREQLEEAHDKCSVLKVATVPTSYFRKARAEIDVAADQWMTAIPRTHPRTLEAHNVFAAAYVLAEDRPRARGHLLAMRDHVNDHPWQYFASGRDKIEERYLKAYAEYIVRVN